MESTIEQIGDMLVMTVQFESLDAKTSRSFQQEFEDACPEGGQVLLDLSKVEFVDSAGLGSIVALLKGLRAKGGDMKICHVHKTVRALFELVRLHRLVDIFNDRDEALA